VEARRGVASLSKNQPPTIQVVLDTNCLFTEAADRLVSNEISSFILNDSPQLGLKITWLIPSVVRSERKYQMMERGRKLLPALTKIENLLGHALGINEDVLVSRVDEAIKRQMDQHQIQELDLATDKIDWRQIIHSATDRLPPFDASEKEKGFRDALILEAFSQLAEVVPKSSTSARLIMLSSDKLLQTATQTRFKDRSNVLIANSLDELRTMLNAVASQLSQEAIDAILPRSLKFFFNGEEDKDALYYKANVYRRIREQFREKYEKLPEPDFDVKTPNVRISHPTFLSKTKQRLSLSSKIIFDLQATQHVLKRSGTGQPPLGLLGAIGSASPTSVSTTSVGALATTGGSSMPYFEEITRNGNAVFEVFWSITLNKRGSLSNPSLERIEMRSASWGS